MSGIGHALKNIFTNTPVQHNSYRGTAFGPNGWFFSKDGLNDVYFDFTGKDGPIDAYDKCPVISTILNKQAYCFVNGNTKFKDLDGKDVENSYVARIKKLIKNPNPYLNWKEFEAKLAIFVRLYGYCIILPIKPVGFDNSYATELYIIPPFMCNIEYHDGLFYKRDFKLIKQIQVVYGNETGYLNPEDIILIKDISISRGNIHLPQSPILSISEQVNNLIAIYKSKGALIKYRGSLGILSPERDPTGNMPIDPKEEKRIQDDLKRYGIMPGQWKYVVTSQPLRWQNMMMPYRDLMLSEWAIDDTMVIADKLDYPYRLLASEKSASYNDVNEFKKQLYIDFILPFSETIYEQLTEWFEGSKYNTTWVKDYSHVHVLQADSQKAATSRLTLNQALKIEFENGIITLNQWREALKEPTTPDGNVYVFDLKKTSMPLAVIIGVGGVQSLISIIANPGLSEEAKRNTLVILFGMSETDAARMVINSNNNETGTGTATTETGTGEAA